MKNKKSINNNCLLSRVGRITGFIVSFFIFSTILYNVLIYFDKIPQEWDYTYIAPGVVIIIFLSYLLKKW